MPYGTDTFDSEITTRVMTYDEIATFCRENFEISAVKSDFNPVNQEKLMTIFVCIMQTLKPDTNPLQIPFAALSSMEIEGHEQYIMLRNVYLSMKQFLEAIRFVGFVFEDVVAPKPKRTQTILSILISFLCFSDTRFEKSKQVENIVIEIEKKRNDMASLGPVLQRRKNNAMVEIVAVDENCAEVQKQFDEGTAKLEIVVDERESLKKEAASKKEKVAAFEKDIETKIETLTKQQEKSDYLKSRIACSPEELDTAIAERNTALARCKSEIQNQRAELLKLASRKTSIDNWKSKFQKTLDIISAISEQQQLISSYETTLEKLKYKGKTIRNEVSDAQQKLEDKETLIKMHKEKWESFATQHQAQVIAKETALKEAKKNKELLSKYFNEKDIVVGSLFNEMEQLSIDIREKEKELKELSGYPPEYYDLFSALDVYHLRLAENVQNVVDNIESLNPMNPPKLPRKD